MNATDTLPQLAFDQADAQAAHDTWGCNCGPGALAAILGKSLDDVRPACETLGFDAKRYTNPTMMANALLALGAKVQRNRLPLDQRIADDETYFPHRGLARLQWTGPWTAKGSNPRWAYGHTHWIASWQIAENVLVFDINGGLWWFAAWQAEIVPLLVADIKRADGGWYVTHSWEVGK